MSAEIEPEGVAWEKRLHFGFFKAFWLTLRKLVFHPNQFFAELHFVDGYSDALLFNIILTTLVTGVFLISGIFIFGYEVMQATLEGQFLLVLLLLPAVAVFNSFFETAISHPFVLLFGGLGGFSGTFNVVAYTPPLIYSLGLIDAITLFIQKLLLHSMKPHWLTAGWQIVSAGLCLWSIAILVIGYRKVHQMGIVRAFLSVLTPLLIFLLILYAHHRYR